MPKSHNQYISPKTISNCFVWSKNIEAEIKKRLDGYSLNLCSGRSGVGDVRIDLIIWKKHRPRYRIANLLGDANKIPFKDNSFDTVMSDPIYDKLEPPFLDEIVRVLRPGGKLMYYYPVIPCHKSLNLVETILYPNFGSKYLRILSVFINCKLSFFGELIGQLWSTPHELDL